MKNQSQNIWQADEDLIRNALQRAFEDDAPPSDRLDRLMEQLRLSDRAVLPPGM